MPRIEDVLAAIRARLLKRHNNDPVAAEQDAFWILEAISGKAKSLLLAQQEITLSSAQQEKLEQWLHAHVEQQEPLQYLIGSVPFNDTDILVEKPILIPRPETEEWVIKLIEKLKPLRKQLSAQPIKILDLCAGTGCIAIALAKTFPEFQIIASDINPQAIELIKKNIAHNNVHNVTVYQADLFTGLPKTELFDLIVSNPPYISEHDWTGLDTSVKNWEDKRALVGGIDGLGIIRRIIEDAKFWIKKNELFYTHNIPQLVLEIDYYQGPMVTDWLALNGFGSITIEKDLEGKERVAYAQRL